MFYVFLCFYDIQDRHLRPLQKFFQLLLLLSLSWQKLKTLVSNKTATGLWEDQQSLTLDQAVGDSGTIREYQKVYLEIIGDINLSHPDAVLNLGHYR